MSKIVLLLAADTDIQSAYEFYEAIQEGRGELFLRHLDAAFTLLSQFTEIAPVFREPYRRLLVSGFPFGVFYTLQGERIIVCGVMDLRQDPEIVRRRTS